MKWYINATMTNIGTYPLAWDVVNEAIADGPHVNKTSPWSIVDNYICKAFQAAKEAQPTAQLFYNDYKHGSMVGAFASKSDKVYELVESLVNLGCGIDGVGFQNHLDITFTDEEIEGIRSNIQRYNKLGIKVHITETDVRCNQLGDCNVTTWTDDMLQRQADIYNGILKVCLEEPNCMNFESWGYTDAFSFLKAPQNGLMMDDNFGRKLAYTQMLETLNGWDKNSEVCKAKLAGRS